MTERFEYDALRQLLLIEMQFESLDSSKRWITPLTHRQFYPREMEALLHYNGFGDIIWTRDFLDLPPDDETDSLVVNCRARRGFRS